MRLIFILKSIILSDPKIACSSMLGALIQRGLVILHAHINYVYIMIMAISASQRLTSFIVSGRGVKYMEWM